MSELTVEPNHEEEPSGFINLYDGLTGQIIPNTTSDLIRLESRDIDEPLFKRLVGVPADMHGITAVLISDRPGFVAQVVPFHVYPSRFEGMESEPPEDCDIYIEWSDDGVALSPEFDIERALESVTIHPKGEKLAANVEALIREHVSYREGENPHVDPNAMWNITILDEDDIRRNLISLSDFEPTALLEFAGK